MNISKSFILLLIFGCPNIFFSQDSLQLDSLILKITTADNYDRPSNVEGVDVIYSEINSLVYRHSDKLKSFKSNYLIKKKCVRTIDYDTILEHKDDSLSIKISKIVSKRLISDLYYEASTSKCCDSIVKHDEYIELVACCDVDNDDFDINQKWLNKNINKRTILKRAAFTDEDWRFKNDYTSRKEKLLAFKGYSNIDSLNLFLSKTQSPLGLTFSSAGMKRIWVNLIQGNDTIVNLFKLIDSRNQGIWLNNNTDKELYNPKINLIIHELLPDKNLFKSIIKREFIREEYIDWIIHRWSKVR